MKIRRGSVSRGHVVGGVRLAGWMWVMGLSSLLGGESGTRCIPWEELGARVEATEGLGVERTREGARLRCDFQRMSGEVTRDGLWLTSTSDGGGRFCVKATGLSRGETSQVTFSKSGRVVVSGSLARWERNGLVEEYSTTVAGVRQDFLVGKRPGGSGLLKLHLDVAGASICVAEGGVRLVLDGSGRAINYHRLRVSDAAGRVLTARMEAGPADVVISVDDADAVYPVRIDPTFTDANWTSLGGIRGTDQYVWTTAVDGSGNLYVGGDFTIAGGVVANHIAKWDGTSWSALGTGMNSNVLAIAVLGSDVYAGGTFTTAGGVVATNIARWNGSAWSRVGGGPVGGIGATPSSVGAMAFLGTNLYVGGNFTNMGGVGATYLAMWNGTAWSSVNGGVNSTVFDLFVSGSDLFVGGAFTLAGGNVAKNIARYSSGVWSSMNGGASSTVFAFAGVSTNLYVAGGFTNIGGVNVNRLARWNGLTFSAVGTGMDGVTRSLALVGSTLYVGGYFTNAGGVTVSRFAKWDGSAWSAVGSGVGNTSIAYDMVVSGTNVFVGGSFINAGGVSLANVARLSGDTWSSLGSGLDAYVWCLAASGSNLYAGGFFTNAGSVAAARVARWNGSTWSALGSGLNGFVGALATSGTNVYAAGQFTTAGGNSANYVARWNGSTWSALGSGLNSNAFALAVSGTDVFVGGAFTTAGGAPASRVAKWNGTAWSALGSGAADNVFALAASGTNLYAAGLFTNVGGVAGTTNVARWNGTSWSALGSGINGAVYTLLATGTNLFAGGVFTNAGAIQVPRVARWNGSVWSSLGTGIGLASSAVYALAGTSTNLYAAGLFTNAGTVTANSIARWDGSAWTGLGSGPSLFGAPQYAAVYGLASAGTNLFVGGSFNIMGGKAAGYVARAEDFAGGAVAGPEIAVEQPAGTDLADGGTVNYVGALVGGTSNRVFTIRNVGSTDLTGISISKDGVNTNEFVVTASPASSVVAGGSTTFTVQFAPTNLGVRTAAIHIASNDADENPFDLTLTGAGLNALDAWRVQWFGTTNNSGPSANFADADGDGHTNAFEYVAGLVPTSSTSRFTVVASLVTNQPSSRRIQFSPRFPDRTYVVQTATNLTGGWGNAAGTNVDVGTLRTFIHTNATGRLRYYRVNVIKP